MLSPFAVSFTNKTNPQLLFPASDAVLTCSNPSPRPTLSAYCWSGGQRSTTLLPRLSSSHLTCCWESSSAHGGLSCLNATAIWVHLHTGSQLTLSGPGCGLHPEVTTEGGQGRVGEGSWGDLEKWDFSKPEARWPILLYVSQKCK